MNCTTLCSTPVVSETCAGSLGQITTALSLLPKYPKLTCTNTMNKKHLASFFSTSSSSVSWAHLPQELLDQIFHLLSISDLQRGRLICSPWCGVAKLSMPPFPLPFESPQLLLTQPDNSFSFFDLLAGWFVLVSATDQKPYGICLFNLVLNVQIPLPDLEFPIIKATLSAPPGCPYCVVAVLGRSTSVALCEPAGKILQVLNFEKPVIGDIVFWRNRLCAVEIQGKIHVLICNFDMESRRTSILTVRVPRRWRNCTRFLVESINGDLLAVAGPNHSNRVSVFKLDLQYRAWEKMELIRD